MTPTSGTEARETRRHANFVRLFLGDTILHGFASALLGVFIPVFVYIVSGHSLYLTLLYFGGTHALYALLLPWCAHAITRLGFNRSLAIGMLMMAGFKATAVFVTQDTFLYLVPLLVLTITFFRIFFWLPYHVDFTLFSDPAWRGREVGIVSSVRLLLGIVGPIIGGLVLATAGFAPLFVFSVILYLIAAMYFLYLPEVHARFEWTYTKTFSQLFSARYRQASTAFIAAGIDNHLNLILWPIFIFLLMEQAYFDMGIVLGLIAGIAALLRILVGAYLDTSFQAKERMLRIGATLHSMGWVFKTLVVTGPQIVLAGVYHSFSKLFLATSFTTLTYDRSADEKGCVDEFTVVHEVAINIGYASAALITAGVYVALGDIRYVFVVGVLSSLFLTTLTKRSTKRS